MEEGGEIAHTHGLLHVVGDDDDGVIPRELRDELLDLQRGDGIERGAGFVHQKDVRHRGDGSCDAQTLLLTAGKTERVGLEAVFELVPKRGLREGALHGLVEGGFVLHAVHAEAVGHVFVDGLREGIRFLEHHADLLAQLREIDIGVVDVLAFDEDFALRDARTGHAVVHAVDAAQQRAFAATGRTDQSGDAVVFDVELDAIQRRLAAIAEVHVAHLHDRGWFGGGWSAFGHYHLYFLRR